MLGIVRYSEYIDTFEVVVVVALSVLSCILSWFSNFLLTNSVTVRVGATQFNSGPNL